MATVKPWEENWGVSRLDATTLDEGDLQCARFTRLHEREQEQVSADRAKLAAQAPAMARLLLKHQWVKDESGDGRRYCPACPMDEEQGHYDNCEILAVLRAAGVLP